MLLSAHQVKNSRLRIALLVCLAMLTFVTSAGAWWNKEWTIRKKITVDTSGITGSIGTATILVRLSADFPFSSAKDDGGDIRFIAEDDKTPLSFHIESYDSNLGEGFVWVKVPDIKPGAQTSLWLYLGNGGDKAARGNDSKDSYDSDTVLACHFSETSGPPNDSSADNNKVESTAVTSPTAQIGNGILLSKATGMTIPASPSLDWTAGGALTLSIWMQPAALAQNAVLFSRRDASGNGLVLGLNEGVPYVEAGSERSTPGAAFVKDTWRLIAVVAEGAKITLYVDGESYGTLNASLPALNTPLQFGKQAAADAGDAGVPFAGAVDELQIAKVARPPGYLKLLAANQGPNDKAAKLLAMGSDEGSGHGGGESEFGKQLTLIKDISKSLTFDGWVVIGLCALLAVIGWVVTALKFAYLNRVKTATTAFLKQWDNLSANLHVLDHGDAESIKSMGGNANGKMQKTLRQSPLYHIYQIGFSEIQHRAANAREGFKGLSGRSMQSIRATLDGGLVREVQRLNSNLVFLTIGIAGGPYLGLLGTVIGVMITFAVIAKSGAVEVNSIAPGIAGALLATVAGLAVAIPALFAYSYISSRIKDTISEMQIFIDEFVAKIAEAFPTSNE